MTVVCMVVLIQVTLNSGMLLIQICKNGLNPFKSEWLRLQNVVVVDEGEG